MKKRGNRKLPRIATRFLIRPEPLSSWNGWRCGNPDGRTPAMMIG